MNKNVLITLKKELRSIFRDKKTLLRLLLFPIIIPIIIIMYGEMFEAMDGETETYTVGINYQITNEENEIIKNSNLESIYYKDISELENAYESHDIEGYITYNEESKTYTVYVDESSDTGLNVSSYVNVYLETYSNYLTNKYLVEQNIDLNEAYNTFNVEYEQLNSKNYILSIIISLSITYIIMSIVLATGNMATGATATERENSTLETILTFPIKKNELILGKYLSCAILGIISSLIAFILTIIGIIFAKSHYSMFEYTEFIINIPIIVECIITIIVASFFIAGIAIMLCGLSKSYKEAQSSVSFLNMLTIIPLFISLAGAEIKNIYYLIPIFNHEQIILDIFNNNLVLSNFILTMISSIIYIAIVIFLVIKSYNKEKVLFTN